LASVLKDIKSERPNVTQKDNLRLLFVTRWFLEFFLLHRKLRLDSKAAKPQGFGAISVVTEGGWMTWVLRRMREAVDEKPRLWVELQAGVECLTQILLLTDAMSAADIVDPGLSEAADTLQHQIIYNGEVLDLAFESLKSYKDRTQSLAYLDASVHLAYALMRMLERLGKGNGEVYVRQKVKKRKKKKGNNNCYLPTTNSVSDSQNY
jgi:replication fork protection complex subunit Tof1/Swi1